MYGGPDAKQHSNDACAQNVKGATRVTTGLPMDYVSTIAKQERAHFGLCCIRTRNDVSLPLPIDCVA